MKRRISLLLSFLLLFSSISFQAVSASTTTKSYQAEKANKSANAVISKKYKGYKGTGYVNLSKKNAYVTFKINWNSKTDKSLSVRYALGGSKNVQINLKAGNTIKKLTLKPTKKWNTWKTSYLRLNLKSGSQSVRLQLLSSNAVFIDQLSFTRGSVMPTIRPTIQPSPSVNPSPTISPTIRPTAATYDVTKPWEVFPDQTPWPVDRSVQSTKAYFVAPDGNDSQAGTVGSPWKDLQTSINKLQPGDALYLRGGTYTPPTKININDKNLTSSEWITISAYMDEIPVIDGHNYDKQGATQSSFSHDSGFVNLYRSNNIIIKNITVQNAHCKGIAVDRCNNIQLLNNTVRNTFSCGIAIWDYSSTKTNAYKNFKIIGNTIIKATTWDMIPANTAKTGEPPHEAISIAGATDFEVAFNHVYNCDKEGIDVKEVSKNGTVHHNYVHDVDRQGLYADAWFGMLSNVRFYNNIVNNNGGAGLALSVEGSGSYLKDVTFDHNLVFNNKGTGFFISKWGNNLMRENVKVFNNTFVHNGHGNEDGKIFWITGGIHFFSSNIKGMEIYNNILSDNGTFELGFSQSYYSSTKTIAQTLTEKTSSVHDNLIDYRDNTVFPIFLAWPNENADVYNGLNPSLGNPMFSNVAENDYRLTMSSPGKHAGCLPLY